MNGENNEKTPARKPDGTFAPGVSGNPKGRPPKKTFRDYFNEEEEENLIIRVKEVMAERPEILKMVVEHIFGKPNQKTDVDVTSGGKPITPILGNVFGNNGTTEDSEAEEED